MLVNPERTTNVIETLMDWYHGGRDGLMSGAELPESEPPKGVARGSYEHIMFLTLTVSIDYQRSAVDLWEAARRSWEDETTRWVFSPNEISTREKAELIAALARHRLSKKQQKDARIWGTVATSFLRLFGGDPKRLFERYSYDALLIYCAMRTRYPRQFPYLAGATGTSKILSLWLRMLHDEAGVQFKNIEDVPLPIDIHTARATITTGCLAGQFEGTFTDLAVQAQDAWRDACERTKYYPLQLDEPLWNLSRLGCSTRLNGSPCPKRHLCRLASLCSANLPESIITLSQDGKSRIDTNYPEAVKRGWQW